MIYLCCSRISVQSESAVYLIKMGREKGGNGRNRSRPSSSRSAPILIAKLCYCISLCCVDCLTLLVVFI